MSQDALFQLGKVSVAPNTSPAEDHFSCPARRAAAALQAHLHPMQDQVCASRTPV